MGLERTDGFRNDAVRIALTSGLNRKQVADDLGVGMSTLNKWETRRSAEVAIFEYFNGFYNPRRSHSALSW